MNWVQRNTADAERIAKIREDRHLKHKSHRPLSVGYEAVGVFGELKFYHITGFKVDERGLTQGDGGIDFWTPAGPIDVKTARKALNLGVEEGKIKRPEMIYVLAQLNQDDVEMLGWEYGHEMLKQKVGTFNGHTVKNHIKHRSQLRPMPELYGMLNLREPGMEG